jgi:hypothetical protein
VSSKLSKVHAFLEPKKWSSWLPLTEWWYNTSYHTSLKCTPFEALYGYKPPMISEVMIPRHEAIAIDFLEQKQHMIAKLRDNLIQAQERIKKYVEKKVRKAIPGGRHGLPEDAAI